MFSNNLDIKLNGFIYFTTLIQYNPLRHIFSRYIYSHLNFIPQEKEILEPKKTNNIQCMRKLKEKGV